MTTSAGILFKEPEATLWAEIILPLAVPTTYTYAVPENMASRTISGCRAEVIFGQNKKYAGIIKSNHYTKACLSNQIHFKCAG